MRRASAYNNLARTGLFNRAYKLDVAGQVHATGFPTSSDMRFKEDIHPIDNALDKVLRLNGVYFKWNQLHRETLKRSSALTSRQVGLIAQQVRECFLRLSRNGLIRVRRTT
jgi:hypothetical protein